MACIRYFRRNRRKELKDIGLEVEREILKMKARRPRRGKEISIEPLLRKRRKRDGSLK
jgi:hypothetical protein